MDEENGKEVHEHRDARLKNLSIYDSVQEVKYREQKELVSAVHQYGEKIDDGYEWHFEGDCPIVAAYDYDNPCDVVILAVRASNDGRITIIGDEKNDRGNEYEIDADDIYFSVSLLLAVLQFRFGSLCFYILSGGKIPMNSPTIRNSSAFSSSIMIGE